MFLQLVAHSRQLSVNKKHPVTLSRDGVFLCFSWIGSLKCSEDLLNFFRLVQGAQAASTDLYFDGFTLAHQSLFVDIGLKPRLGVSVGVADIVAGHSRF